MDTVGKNLDNPNNWRRELEKEFKQLLRWGHATKQAADKSEWRTLVSVICARGHQENLVK